LFLLLALALAEFLPYWHQCLDARAAIGGEMHQFTVLYTACTDDLPEEESLALYRDVTTMDDSRDCRIDTSLVVSRALAKQMKIKPICETDAIPGPPISPFAFPSMPNPKLHPAP
jgi:hypothetical protein